MNVCRKFASIAIVVIWTSLLPVWAQTSLDSLQHLPEVVVTERYADREIRSTAPMQILSGKAIRNLNVLQVSDAVKHFSGVAVKDYGGIGGLKTVSVRSLGAAHTAVNYNGIAVTDVQTGQIDIGRFSLDNVENISLLSGQTDRIFQPARAFASASTLNITTSAPSFADAKKTNGRVSVKGGSFGLFNPALNINARVSEKMSATFSSEWMSANGSYPYVLHYGASGIDSSSVEKRENTDVQNLRLESALFVRFSEQSRGNIRLYYFQSERGLPGATIFYNTENFSKQRLWDRTFFTQAHFEHTFSPKWAVQANAKHNRGYLRYLDPTFLGAEGKIEDIFNQSETYGSLSALYRAFEKLSFSASTDFSANTMHANRNNFATPTRLTAQSVVAAKWVSNQLLSTASLLYTQTFESTRNGEPAENRTKFSPYVSVSVKPFSDVDFRFRAFYKNSFRLPTFNDLYYPAIGMRQLLPEDANQFNAGATFGTSIGNAVPLLTLSADAYQNRIKNKIVAYPTGNLHQWTMMNLGAVKINGLDVSAEGIIKLQNTGNLVVGATYTLQRAMDVTDSEKITYKHQLPYTPKHSGSARATLETSWFHVAYAVLWSGQRFSNRYNGNEFRMSGYSDHSVSVAKSLNTRFGKADLSVEALNLAGKNYEIVRNYPMPGRSFRANLSLNF
ncbi:MAG: TonB-dependent receptor plug domain-containing protein [Bacteroidia bacterium]|nr:TonB-dependent receptor plug domain-containing protein [Bacteroidia bacterium]